MKIQKKDIMVFYVLIILTIIFTICDLVASSCNLLVTSLVFSSITALITLIGQRKKQASAIYDSVDLTEAFISKTFSNSNLVFAILDVLCCILALFTGVFIIALISRSAFALRLVIIMNKYKTVAFGILAFVFTYLLKKGDRKKMSEEVKEFKEVKEIKENKIKKFFVKFGKAIKNGLKYIFVTNPKASATTIINGALSAVFGYSLTLGQLGITMPKLYIGTFDVVPLICAIVVFCLVEFLGLKYAFETNKQADDRKKIEKAERKIKKVAKDAAKETKRKEKENAILEAKAKALVEQRKAEAERIAKENEERAKVEALANQIEAEENNKQ